MPVMARRQPSRRKRPKPPRERPGVAGGVRDLKRRDNIRRLTESGLTRFLADGTAAVTVDDIVDHAGMAKGSFYRYVADKADLVNLIVAPVVVEVTQALDRCEDALQRAEPSALASIYLQLAAELSAVVTRHAPRVLLYLQEARAPASGSRAAIHALADLITDRAIRITEVARANGLIRDVDPRVAAWTVTGAIDALLYAYLRGRKPLVEEIPTITRELVTIVLRGIRP